MHRDRPTLQYLVSNGLSVVVTTWEVADRGSLEAAETFYTFSSDLVSLLTVLSALIRLPTYALCDITFRRELFAMLFGRPRVGFPFLILVAIYIPLISGACISPRHEQL